MYRQFNIQQFYALPTQCIYVFCVDLSINLLIGWFLKPRWCAFTARYELGLEMYVGYS